MKIKKIVGRKYVEEPKTELARFYTFRDEQGRWYENIFGEREATKEEAKAIIREELINTPGYIIDEVWGCNIYENI